MISETDKAEKILREKGLDVGLVNPRFVKPMDETLLDQLAEKYSLIVTVEEGMLNGGFGAMVMQYLYQKGYSGKIRNIGIKDQFVEHGSVKELRHMLGIDGENIASSIEKWIKE